MTPLQGRVWNALSDDWQRTSDLRKRISMDFDLKWCVAYMAKKGMVETIFVSNTRYYRLPQPIVQ